MIAGVTQSESASAFFGSETAGVWAPLTPLNSSSVVAEITALGCTSATSCVAAGIELNINSADSFFVSSSTPLSMVTSSLPGATVGVPYSATLQATGGSGTNDWSVSTGTLPAGLSLNAATGLISGTPTGSGSSGFVVTDTDPGPPSQTVTGSLSISVSAAPVNTTPVNTTPVTTTTIIINNPPPVTTPTTSTPPTVTVAAAPAATLGKVSAKGTKVSVTVSCSGAACTGALTLTTVEHLTGAKVTAVTARAKPTATVAKAKAKPKTKTITLAKGSYTVAAGQSKTVTLKLTAAAAKLLTARHKLPAKLALTPAGSKKVTATKTVTLKETAKKKK